MSSGNRSMVLKVVERDFPAEDPAIVIDVLDLYGVESYERERDRVHLAILKLSGGDVDKLLHLVQAAKVDYRDILWLSNMPPLSEIPIE